MSRKHKGRNAEVAKTTTTTTTNKTTTTTTTTVAQTNRERELKAYQAQLTRRERVREALDRDMLGMICELREEDFGDIFGMEKFVVGTAKWMGDENYYFFKDNGSDILAVAHLDTVVDHSERGARFVETAEEGWVVHSGALDDRLGAFIILYLLPALGFEFDILLTVGEEGGCTTGQFFETEKSYNWMIEFDRGGTDVVMYEYENSHISNLVRAAGPRVGVGSFSDISYMEHIGAKGFNWGVGYQDYHSTRGFAYLEDTIKMVAYFLVFAEANRDTPMPHVQQPRRYTGYSGYGGWGGKGSGYGGWGMDKGDDDIPASQEWMRGYHGFSDDEEDDESESLEAFMERKRLERDLDENGDDDEYVADLERLWPTEETYAEGPTDEELRELGLEEVEGDDSVASYTVIKSAVEECIEQGGPDFPMLESKKESASG